MLSATRPRSYFSPIYFALDNCELCFKCSMSSLAVVFLLRPCLWGILAFRIIVETVCKPFTLFHSKCETKLRHQSQLNQPTARMTINYYAVMLPPCALFVKRKRISYSLILINFPMVTSQKHHSKKQAYTSTCIHHCVCCNTNVRHMLRRLLLLRQLLR